jgi:hypothetical protein
LEHDEVMSKEKNCDLEKHETKARLEARSSEGDADIRSKAFSKNIIYNGNKLIILGQELERGW